MTRKSFGRAGGPRKPRGVCIDCAAKSRGTPAATLQGVVRVRDIMSKQVVSLSPERSVDSAKWTFAAAHVSGAPVRDRSGRVIGVLSKSDLVDPMRARNAKTVKDAMRPAVWAVHPDDPAMDAVRLMLEKEVHRLLVLDGPEHLVGIITSMDILRALASGNVLDPVALGLDAESAET